MGSKLRKNDEKCSTIVTNFIEENFYKKQTDAYEIIMDKERQVNGLDAIFKIDGETYLCDEKAAIQYVNRPLHTFSLELRMKNRNGNEMDGWLIDKHKTNNSFMFIWIDRAKKNNLEEINDIQELELALVKKNKIMEYLGNIGWTREKLIKKIEQIKTNPNESMGNLYTNGCKFVYSKQLFEKPINILLPRKKLIEISDYHKIYNETSN